MVDINMQKALKKQQEAQRVIDAENAAQAKNKAKFKELNDNPKQYAEPSTAEIKENFDKKENLNKNIKENFKSKKVSKLTGKSAGSKVNDLSGHSSKSRKDSKAIKTFGIGSEEPKKKNILKRAVDSIRSKLSRDNRIGSRSSSSNVTPINKLQNQNKSNGRG